MKNNKLFLKIYISILSICILTLIVLLILGNITRVGYLTEFNFDQYHVNGTLELNGIDADEINKLFTIDGKLDNNSLINYIFTNENITNYSYVFRIHTYCTFFSQNKVGIPFVLFCLI